MTRRLILAAILGSTGWATAQDRPAVRIGAIRADDTVRAQAPDPKPTALPMPMAQPFAPAVTESRQQLPAPAVGAPPLPPGAVVMGPAVPMTAPGAPVPYSVQPDAPLFADGSPFTLGPATTVGNKFSVGIEYLYFWVQGPSLPPLVTTGPASSNGILGAPGTTTLLGGDDFDDKGRSGGRATLGYWFGSNQCWGLDVSYFQLAEAGNTFAASSTQFPVLARPFFNVNQGINFSELTAFPGLASGNVLVNYENSLWGLEANFKKRLTCNTGCYRLEGLIGFRYLNYDESLGITETFTRAANPTVAIGVPNTVSGTVFDSFSTENDFYGVNLGLQGEVRRGRWFLNGNVKVGLGEMQQSLTINGGQQLNLVGGGVTTAQGGLLALPGANIGTLTQNKFAVVPEIGLNVGYNLTSHLRAYVGYNFLYMSSVLRAADQIDTGLDVTRIPNFPVANATRVNPARPTVPLQDSGLYVHGINFGLQFSW